MLFIIAAAAMPMLILSPLLIYAELEYFIIFRFDIAIFARLHLSILLIFY